MSRSIYFFTSKGRIGRLAFDVASTCFDTCEWSFFTLETEDERAHFEGERHSPDVIISFLNPYIVQSDLLEQVRGRAFNIHPATPEYPGRDPQHFAFYNGTSVTGATLHRMEPSPDSGEILDVLELVADRTKGVTNFIRRSEHASLVVLMRNLPKLIDDSITPVVDKQWCSKSRTTRRDFLGMCRIAPSMPEDEVRRRIEAFFNPEYRSIHVDIHGYRFVYDPKYE